MPVFSFFRSIEMYMEKFLHTLVYTTLYLSILLYTYSFYTCLILFAHVYTCLYTYINTCICIFVYTHFSVNNCLPTRVYHICQCLLVYTFLSIILSINTFLCILVNTYLPIHFCLHIYLYFLFLIDSFPCLYFLSQYFCHGVLSLELHGRTFWFSKIFLRVIVFFIFRWGEVHMGGLAKTGCEGAIQL